MAQQSRLSSLNLDVSILYQRSSQTLYSAKYTSASIMTPKQSTINMAHWKKSARGLATMIPSQTDPLTMTTHSTLERRDIAKALRRLSLQKEQPEILEAAFNEICRTIDSGTPWGIVSVSLELHSFGAHLETT